MRKVYFTESQIKRLLGEDFMSYLPDEEDAAEVPENSYGTETTTSGKIDGKLTDTVCTDRIAKTRVAYSPYGRRNLYSMGNAPLAEGNKKKLDEVNQDLQNTQFNLGKNLKSAVQANAVAANGSDKLLNNMSREAQSGKGFNISSAYKRLRDLKKMATEDPQRFNRIGGNRLIATITNQIETAKGISKRSKETKKNVGIQNAFQKAGGTKQAGNGMAHTTKNSIFN